MKMDALQAIRQAIPHMKSNGIQVKKEHTRLIMEVIHLPEHVKLKAGSTGTLTPAETPMNQTSHEIESIPTSSINENSRIGGRSKGMTV